MANDVNIMLNATDQASAAINKVDKSLDNMEKTGKNTGFSMTELTSAFSLAERGLGYLQGAFDQTVGRVIDYANEVRSLGEINGQSAESNSRLIQSVDDYKIGLEDLMTTQRELSKDGKTLTVDFLGEVADRYNAATNQVDKNKIAQDALGRSWKSYVELLREGKAALLEKSASVEEGLILDEKVLAQTRQYEKDLDTLNDTIDATTMAIGKGLVPAATDLLRMTEANVLALNKMPVVLMAATNGLLETGVNADSAATFIRALGDAAAEIVNATLPSFMRDTADETEAASTAMDGASLSAEELAEQERALAETLKIITNENKDYLKIIEDVTKQQDDYAKKQEDFTAKRADLETQLADLRRQGYWEQGEQIQGTLQKLDELTVAEQDAAAEFELAGRRRILSMLEQKLATDELTKEETAYLLDLGLQWGIYSEAAVADAEKAMRAIERLSSAIINIPGVDYQNTGAYQSYEDRYGAAPRRASGGAAAGMTWVGERGPELIKAPAGSHVYSNVQSQQMAGGPVDLSQSSLDALARIFATAYAQMGR